MTFDFDKLITIGSDKWKTAPFRFYGEKEPFFIGNKIEQDWRDVILSGNTALTLVNSKANGLNYLKLFGATGQVPQEYIDGLTLFGGTEQRNIPSEYTQVEYLESSGTQAINTGVKYTGNNFVIEWEAKDNSTSQGTLFACTGVQPYSGGLFGTHTSRNYYIGTDSGKSVGYSSSDGNFHKWKLVVSGQTATLYKDGVQAGTCELTGTINTTHNIYLFCGGWVSNDDQTLTQFARWELKSWKFTDNGVLKFNAIPAKNGSNVAGIYDTVSGTFFANAGTGTFTAGADVTTPSPDYPMDIVCNNGAIKYETYGLPSGYTKVEYIQSSGTQYIDTGYKFTGNTCSIKCKFKYNRLPADVGWKTIFGSQSSSSTRFCVLQVNDLKILSIGIGEISAGNFVIDDTTLENKLYDVTINLDNINKTITAISNGQTYTTTYTGNAINNLNLPLFAKNTNGTIGEIPEAQILQFEVIEDNVLRTNLIPCRRNSDSVLGMYDTVSKTFLTNAGSGTFTAGAEQLAYIYTDGTQEVVTDSLGNTASAEMLLKVGDYKDTQEVISGSVTRNIGIKVLDGTENWQASDPGYFLANVFSGLSSIAGSLCTHFTVSNSNSHPYDMNIDYGGVQPNHLFVRYDAMTTLSNFKQFLADQYNSGNPVVIVYPLATATTESVSGQFLSKSPVTQTAGAISGLTITTTESTHTTPTPQQPLDINCNNGVVKTTAPLPQSYTALEYIESTGTQYINSNVSYASRDSLRAVADMQFTNITGSQFFGIYASAYCGVNGNSFVIGGYSVITANTNRHIFDLYSDIGGTNTVTLEIDGTPYTYSRNTNSGKFVILGLNGVNICSAKLYSIKLYKNDNLVFDGIPAKRNSDSVIGMYDAVSQTFFTNAGTGAFTTGSELPFIYTDGTVETVQVTGKNLFDGQWQVGIYNTSTGIYNSSATNRICNVDMILIKPLTDYTVSCPSYVLANGMKWLFYDKNKNFISAITTGATTITTPSNAKYINFYIANDLTVATAPDLQIEQGSTATTYEPYFNGGTATAQMLLSVGDYKDTQEVLSGAVTRNIGIKVLDGTENWRLSTSSYQGTNRNLFYAPIPDAIENTIGFCSIALYTTSLTSLVPAPVCRLPDSKNFSIVPFSDTTTIPTVEAWKTYLANQYNAGTPCIVIYPLSSPITESVSPQPLTIQNGTNIIEITEASMDNLGLEVSYKAGVAVTITEVENAQLDNNVEVTING